MLRRNILFCNATNLVQSADGRWIHELGVKRMLRILILICSTEVSPQDCQRETALDIISGPQVASIMTCGVQGQALAASTAAIGRRPDEYMKIRCEHLPDERAAQKL
jgi:hypothetical protein